MKKVEEKSTLTANPNPEAKSTRRTFTAEYRMRILEEADHCAGNGDIGRMLRRERLSASHLSVWRKTRREGVLGALAPKKRGVKPAPVNPLASEVRRLKARIARLEKELDAARVVINVQGKRCGTAGTSPEGRKERLEAIAALVPRAGVSLACQAFRVSKATFYRFLKPASERQRPRKTLAQIRRQVRHNRVFEILCSPRFVDRSPAAVFATLQDEGVRLCSVRTMYRILASRRAGGERRGEAPYQISPGP